MISNIKLQNYKNLNLELNLSEGRNIVVGKNGRGKTNLLESIFTITNGFSFKSQEDENVINWSFSNDFKIDPFLFNTPVHPSVSRSVSGFCL